MSLFFRKYKFTDKKLSRGGLIASGLFLFSAISFVAGVYISFKNHGAGTEIVGILGTVAFLLSIVGLIIGLRSFKEDNVFLGFPWLGTIGNAIILVGMGSIILIGI